MCLHFVRHVKIVNKDELGVRRLRGCWSQGLQPSVIRNYDNRMSGIYPGTVTLLTSGTLHSYYYSFQREGRVRNRTL